MMEQICDLETVKPQEMPIKVCVTFYNKEICYGVCGEKIKCIVVGLSMVEGLFSLYFTVRVVLINMLYRKL